MRRAAGAWAGVIALVLTPCVAHASRFTGIVSHVTDGDTVWVRRDDGKPPLRVRLQGIDAPEICQPFGLKSRQALASIVAHRRVTVTTHGTDNYDRTLGVIERAHEDVGAWMVRRGYAWSYHFKGNAGPYARQEAQARRTRAGLWQQNRPVAPHEFRVKHGHCERG
ncbi:thermonuclease family protein [Caenimonas koreensis DSM 17982]|uniref:Thermonuclease family protein n=2 Tax=Caenimonas TaxID=763439 RepID=A0A844BFG8_9BURK|nr:thermonuclease family protein [Caenimonas koreensis]MRD49201.1 thermonuclease family protein [Caenimonas koreensis DSM 17982]